jgi:5'-nucleotidase
MDLAKKMCIQTFTGRGISLFNPAPSDIDIQDIAHALSNLTRFTGHGKAFYSIAEHCVHVASLLPDCYKLEGLLHDAAEAYINDLSTPLKHSGQLDGYREVEKKLDVAVSVQFDIGHNPHIIKPADRQMLFVEATALLSKPFIPEWAQLLAQIGPPCKKIKIRCWTPKRAKREFLKAFICYNKVLEPM